jgi:hypothetical protein
MLASQIFIGPEKDFSGPNSLSDATLLRDLQQQRWAVISMLIINAGGNLASFPILNSNLNVAKYFIQEIPNGHKLLSQNRPLISPIVENGLQPNRSLQARIIAYLIINYEDQLISSELPNDPLLTKAIYDYLVDEKQILTATKMEKDYLQLISEKINNIDLQLTSFENRVNSIDLAAREKLDLHEPAFLWDIKAKRHHANWGWCVLAFSLMIGACVLVSLYYGSAYIANLPKNKDGELSLVSASLIAVPLIAVAYCLRIVVRLMNINVELADDARQRSAMIQTYLSLLSNPQTKFDEKDRAVLLTAIFRPVNATQPDVSPPTIADLLQKQ